MKDIPENLQDIYDRARLYAALNDSFAPADALIWTNRGTAPGDIQTTARVLAMLRPDCASLPSEHPAPPSP